MNADKRLPTDMRRLRKQNERRILVITLLTLTVVGGGLIGLFFGPIQMLAALPCLLSGAGAILGLWLLFAFVERWLENR
jgi:polyferredoxin